MTSRADILRREAILEAATPALHDLDKFVGEELTPLQLARIKNHIAVPLQGLGALIHVWAVDATRVGVYLGAREHGFEYLSAPPDGCCEAFNAECPDAGWFAYDPTKHTQVDPELIFRRRVSGRKD